MSRLRYAWILLALLLAVSAAGAAKNKKEYWQGRPNFETGISRGYFIWSDGEGWHIRWTTKGNQKHIFSGTIRCDGAFVKFEPVAKEPKDFVKQVSEDTIRFDAKSGGGLDGADFSLSPSARTVTFDLKIDGEKVRTDMVKIGRDKTRPAAVPFTIDRGKP